MFAYRGDSRAAQFCFSNYKVFTRMIKIESVNNISNMFALQYEKLTLLKYLLKLNWNLGILIFGEGGNLEKNPHRINSCIF